MEGRKELVFELTIQSLLAQMKEHSYYLGEALKNDSMSIELAAKIQASDDDDSILKDFIQTGCARLGNLLSRVLGKTAYIWNNDKTKVTFTTKAAANFMESQKDTLKDNMLSYLSVYVLSKWLNIIKPDESQRFDKLLSEIEDDMRQLGAQRDKPLRS